MNRELTATQEMGRLERMYEQKLRQIQAAGGNPQSLLFLVRSAEAAAISDAIRGYLSK